MDYYLNFVAQKTITEKNTLHVNGGVYFTGNTSTGAEGIRSTSGVVYTGGMSLVRQITPQFDLGVEVFGAVTKNFDLGRGQLQTQIGGNYGIRKNMTIDFGLIEGYDQSSPKIGPLIGLSINF